MTDAEDRKEKALRNTLKCLFKNFDNQLVDLYFKIHRILMLNLLFSYKIWSRAVQSLAIVDVLISLANYINNSSGPTCRPQLLDANEENVSNSSIIKEKQK